MMSIVTEAEQTDTSFSHIPIIDLQNARSSDEAERRAVATEVRKACMTAGFFYVKNHGIPQPTIDAVHQAAESFFALSEETKMTIRNHGQTNANFKGYTPLRSAKNDPNGDGDVHEGFLAGWEPLHTSSPNSSSPSSTSTPLQPNTQPSLQNEAKSDETSSSAQFIGTNTWPDPASSPSLKTFREDVMRYYHAVVGLGKVLFPLFAMALELEEGWFRDKTKSSAALMRLLHYPPQYGEVDDRVIGIGAHTEYAFLSSHLVICATSQFVDLHCHSSWEVRPTVSIQYT
jgi:isopenicillin N synthase-like dioxygenase